MSISLLFEGTFSHLIHSVHEQNYIAYVMAYSACIGPYKNDDCLNSKEAKKTNLKNDATTKSIFNFFVFVLLIIVVKMIL